MPAVVFVRGEAHATAFVLVQSLMSVGLNGSGVGSLPVPHCELDRTYVKEYCTSCVLLDATAPVVVVKLPLDE
jgi:hypothetical protein